MAMSVKSAQKSALSRLPDLLLAWGFFLFINLKAVDFTIPKWVYICKSDKKWVDRNYIRKLSNKNGFC